MLTSARVKEKEKVKGRTTKGKEKESMGKEMTAKEKDGEEKTEEKDGTGGKSRLKERIKAREEVRKAKGCMSVRTAVIGTGGTQSIRGKEETGKEEIGMGQFHLFRAIHGCVDCAR